MHPVTPSRSKKKGENKHLANKTIDTLAIDDGCPDILGDSLDCDVGQSDVEGCSDGWLLGKLDNEGLVDSCILGCEYGFDVGQSYT